MGKSESENKLNERGPGPFSQTFFHGTKADLKIGNPTMSYRSEHPFRVVGEIAIWQGHSPEQVKAMKDGLARLKEQGIEAIED